MMDATPGVAASERAHDPTRLALRARDAARAIGVSPRLLWTLTKQKLIPHVRIGRVIVYPVSELQRWLAEQAGRESKP